MSLGRPKVRLFVEADLALGLTIGLIPERSHYLNHVMRLGKGDEVCLFNGRDGEWRVAIDAFGRGWCSLTVNERLRLRANCREAAEQCGRLTLPEVFEPGPLGDLLGRWPSERRLMFCDEKGAGKPAGAALSGAEGGPWAVLVGPEGGFAPDELVELRRLPFALGVTLGPRILRADTAAVAALSLWQHHLGDWRERSGGG